MLGIVRSEDGPGAILKERRIHLICDILGHRSAFLLLHSAADTFFENRIIAVFAPQLHRLKVRCFAVAHETRRAGMIETGRMEHGPMGQNHIIRAAGDFRHAQSRTGFVNESFAYELCDALGFGAACRWMRVAPTFRFRPVRRRAELVAIPKVWARPVPGADR